MSALPPPQESSEFRTALHKPSFDFGRVFGWTFIGLWRSGGPLMGAMAVCSVLAAVMPILMAYALGLPSYEAAPEGGDVPTDFVFGVMAIIGLGVGYVFYAVCMEVSYRNFLGYAGEIRDTVRRCLRFVLPLFVISLLYTLGFYLGLLALIIPGIILSVGWAVAGPAYMFENTGIFSSFGRSWALTRGYKWPVFFFQFLLGLVAQAVLIVFLIISVMIVALIVMFIEAAFGGVTPPDMVVGGTLALTASFFLLYAGLYASMASAIYAECVGLQDRWAESLSKPLRV